MKQGGKFLFVATIAVLIPFFHNSSAFAQDVLAGVDLWETRPGDAVHVFGGGSECPPIPADFFEPGSDPFDGQVAFQGQPLQTIPSGILGATDTIVERLNDAVLPLSGCPSSATVPIEIVALSLVSVQPITVGGFPPTLWDVEVCLSEAVSQQTGSKTINKECDDGGTFTAQIPVTPKFTFTKVGDPLDKRVLDYGVEGLNPILYDITDGHWLYADHGFSVHTSPGGVLVDHDCDGISDVAVGSSSNFYPGLQATPCDCQSVPIDYNVVPTLWQSPDCGSHIVYPPQEQPHFKWLQPPDLTDHGIDVNATFPFILADDFLCTETGPLTEIHIWASWLFDILPLQDPAAVSFTLSIHADIPAGAPENPHPWSIPGETLWVGSPPFTVQLFSTGPEGWLDPPDFFIPPPADTMCWEYIFTLDPSEFIQQGTPSNPVIYWLDVQATPVEEAYFGWKTSTDHWNDDATFTQGIEPLPPVFFDWFELLYPPGHPFFPESIDLAFAIIGEPAQLTGACCFPDPTGSGTTLCTDTNQTNCEQTLSGVYKGDGTLCLDDSGDGDGIVEPCDNCPTTPNGPLQGTCTAVVGVNQIVSTGQFCTVDADCDPLEFCEKVQADTYPPGGNSIGDACDCEGNFDCDVDTSVDADDVTAFLADFGRSIFFNPCTNGDTCNGDFLCDGDVDADDVTKFLEDFGRSTFFLPCPICPGGPWCSYP